MSIAWAILVTVLEILCHCTEILCHQTEILCPRTEIPCQKKIRKVEVSKEIDSLNDAFIDVTKEKILKVDDISNNDDHFSAIFYLEHLEVDGGSSILVVVGGKSSLYDNDNYGFSEKYEFDYTT